MVDLWDGYGTVLDCDRSGHETDPYWWARVRWDDGRVETVGTFTLAPASLYRGSIAHLRAAGDRTRN